MAMGERSECRLGRGTTHAHFASLPVTADGIDEGASLSSLARVLYDEGSAEALFYSYGALRPVAGASGGRPTRDRFEFFLDLTRDEDEIAAGIKRAHRARIRKGTNAGWELRYLNGAGAARALYEVQTRAAERQAERGSGYEVSRIDEDAIAAITDRSKAQGLQVVAGFAGEELLAALLIGWGGRSGILRERRLNTGGLPTIRRPLAAVADGGRPQSRRLPQLQPRRHAQGRRRTQSPTAWALRVQEDIRHRSSSLSGRALPAPPGALGSARPGGRIQGLRSRATDAPTWIR